MSIAAGHSGSTNDVDSTFILSEVIKLKTKTSCTPKKGRHNQFVCKQYERKYYHWQLLAFDVE